jgi:purine-binding chemotaxis protein CheW
VKALSKIVVFSMRDASTKKKTDYGLDIEQVQEIGTLEEVTRVPGAPSHVKGVMNLRGKIITIVDMKRMLGISSDAASGTYGSSDRIIVAQFGQSIIGLLVDEVDQVLEIAASDVEPAPSVLSETAPYIKGIVKLKGNLYVLLDLQIMFANESPTAAHPFVQADGNGKSLADIPVHSNQKTVAEAK